MAFAIACASRDDGSIDTSQFAVALPDAQSEAAAQTPLTEDPLARLAPTFSYAGGSFQISLAPGAGIVIGAGDASPWLWGTTSTCPFCIFHYSNDLAGGRTWVPEPNVPQSSTNTLSIAVSPEGTPWKIDSARHVWARTAPGTWTQKGATFQAYEIGVGRLSGSDNVAWAIGTACGGSPLNCPIYQWDGTNWNVRPGLARHVAVSPDGTNIYVVNNTGNIYKWFGTGFLGWPGSGCVGCGRFTGDTLGWPIIGAAANDSVWVIGNTGGANGNNVYSWLPTTSSWTQVAGSAAALSVSADGTPWIIDAHNVIYEYVSSWQNVGPHGFNFNANGTNYIYSGEIHDIDGTNLTLSNGAILAAATSGGVWSSPTIGWVPINDVGAGATARPGPNMSTGTVAAKPGDPNTVVVGTGVVGGLNNPTNSLGNGIWVTHNATTSTVLWAPATCKIAAGRTIPCPSQIVKVRYSADASAIYVAGYASGQNEVLSSIDDGANFTLLQSTTCALTGADVFTDLVVDPNNSNTAFLGVGSTQPTLGPNGEGVVRLTNGKNPSLAQCTRSIPQPLFSGASAVITLVALGITSSSVVYADVAGLSCTAGTCVGTDGSSNRAEDFQGIFGTNSASPNPPVTWPAWGVVAASSGNQAFIGSQGGHDWAFGTNPAGTLILHGGVGLYQGIACTAIGCQYFLPESGPHNDQHAIVWGSNNVVYLANDGGIFDSLDGGSTWQSDINTLGVANELSVDVGQNVVYAAAWDVGGHYSRDGGATWQGDFVIAGVDGYQVLVDPANFQNAFYCGSGSSGPNQAKRSASIGAGPWTPINSSPISDDIDFCTMAKSSTSNLFTIYGNEIYQSPNLGASWAPYFSALTAKPTNLLVTSEQPAPTIYLTADNVTTLQVSMGNTAFQATQLPTTWPASFNIASRATWGSGVVTLNKSTNDLYITGTQPGSTGGVVYVAPGASHGLTSTAWSSLSGTKGYNNELLNSIAVDSAGRAVILATEGRAGVGIYRLNNPDAQDTVSSARHHWRPWVFGLPTSSQPVSWTTGQYENGVYYYYSAVWGRGVWKREARGGDF